jgi:hypothetical protein
MKLAQEKKNKELQANVSKLLNKKLEMKQAVLVKRSSSWKGKKKGFLNDFEYDEWEDTVKNRAGAQSRGNKR